MDSSTYLRRERPIPEPSSVHDPRSRLLAFGTLDEEMPLESSSLDIPCCCTFLCASVAANKRSRVLSIWESKAVAACEGGILVLGRCLVAARSDHADDYRALDLGCSRRKRTGRSSGSVNMNPCCRVCVKVELVSMSKYGCYFWIKCTSCGVWSGGSRTSCRKKWVGL